MKYFYSIMFLIAVIVWVIMAVNRDIYGMWIALAFEWIFIVGIQVTINDR